MRQLALNALPKQCQLRAQLEVSDMHLMRGMPESYIKDRLSHELGRHLGQKSSSFIQRVPSPYGPHPMYCPGTTRFTAEVFVFTEAELLEFAERMHKCGASSVRSHMIQTEVGLKVGAVKSKLKESLHAHVDKALA